MGVPFLLTNQKVRALESASIPEVVACVAGVERGGREFSERDACHAGYRGRTVVAKQHLPKITCSANSRIRLFFSRHPGMWHIRPQHCP